MRYFPQGLIFDEQDRDVIAALGMILTDLHPSAIRVLLTTDATAAGELLNSDMLNARLDNILGDTRKLLQWGVSYEAHRHHHPRYREPAPADEERDDRFEDLRTRLARSTKD